MQVQRINNNQPSFGAIRFQDGLLNNKNRKAIYDFITGKLNEVDPSDRLKRSFVKRAEDNKLDVLFTRKDKYSVRVDVLSQKAFENNYFAISRLNDDTHVGTYCLPLQFNIRHFNNTFNKSREKLTNFYTRVKNGLLCVLSNRGK